MDRRAEGQVMRALAAAVLGLGVLVAAAQASAQGVPGRKPASPPVQAAIEKLKAGDPAELIGLADSGAPDAEFYLGTFMIFGAKVPKDGVKGCAYIAKASVSWPEAMHVVGECYEYGYGGEKDMDKAMSAFHKAGDMGFPKSRCAEGNVLFELQRDEARALALCEEGAEAGDPDAETDVGDFYLMGRHVTKDVAMARQWYEKAVAANGQKNAAFTLGQIYWNGDTVPKDTAKAAEYWRIAYAGGRADAALQLGNEAFIRAGRAEKNAWRIAGLDEAIGWYEKAAADSRNPQIQAPAKERLTLMRQLRDLMVRQGKGN
jgi:hypothetical protein